MFSGTPYPALLMIKSNERNFAMLPNKGAAFADLFANRHGQRTVLQQVEVQITHALGIDAKRLRGSLGSSSRGKPHRVIQTLQPRLQHLTVKTLIGKRLKRPNVMRSARITNELKRQVAKILNSWMQHTCSLLNTNARVLNDGVDNGRKDGDADLEEDVQRRECLSSKLTKAPPNVHDLLRVDLSDGHSGCGCSSCR